MELEKEINPLRSVFSTVEVHLTSIAILPLSKMKSTFKPLLVRQYWILIRFFYTGVLVAFTLTTRGIPSTSCAFLAKASTT